MMARGRLKRLGCRLRVTLVGRQVVVEPVDDTLIDSAFRRGFGVVLRRHGDAFELLAAHDRDKPVAGK